MSASSRTSQPYIETTGDRSKAFTTCWMYPVDGLSLGSWLEALYLTKPIHTALKVCPDKFFPLSLPAEMVRMIYGWVLKATAEESRRTWSSIWRYYSNPDLVRQDFPAGRQWRQRRLCDEYIYEMHLTLCDKEEHFHSAREEFAAEFGLQARFDGFDSGKQSHQGYTLDRKLIGWLSLPIACHASSFGQIEPKVPRKLSDDERKRFGRVLKDLDLPFQKVKIRSRKPLLDEESSAASRLWPEILRDQQGQGLSSSARPTGIMLTFNRRRMAKIVSGLDYACCGYILGKCIKKHEGQWHLAFKKRKNECSEGALILHSYGRTVW